jgi:hypothetical protein
MLHASFGVRAGPTGRCVHHDRAFRERERAFDRYDEAIVWEKANLDKILTLASTPRRHLTPGVIRQAIFDFASLL